MDDAEAQARIRRLHPEQAHCRFLVEHPNACMVLPRQIGDAPAGAMCPNNPMIRHGDLLAEIEQGAWIVARVEMIARLPQLLTNDSSPIDVTMASLYQEWRRAERSGWNPSDS